MSELFEFLERSKSKRDKSLRKAKKILDKLSKTRNNSPIHNKFPSLSPKGFNKFNQRINSRIKSIFYPNENKTLETRLRRIRKKAENSVFSKIYKAVRNKTTTYLDSQRRRFKITEKINPSEQMTSKKRMASPTLNYIYEKKINHLIHYKSQRAKHILNKIYFQKL